MESGKRIAYIDICKGLTMVCVMLAHFTYGSMLCKIIYSFHMPLFFILAGYTYKKKETKEQIAIGIKKSVKRLILPTIIVVIFEITADILWGGYSLERGICCFIKSFTYDDYIGTEGLHIGYMWFLMALFSSRIVYDYVYMYIERRNKRLWFLCIMALVSGIISRFTFFPWFMDSVFLCVLYMEIGNRIKNTKIIENIKNITYVGMLIIWFVIASSYNMMLSINAREYNVILVINSILGAICFMRLSYLLENIKSSKILKFIGQNTIILLCIHQIEHYFVLDSIIPNCNIKGVKFIIRFFAHIALLYIVIYTKRKIKEKHDSKTLNNIKEKEKKHERNVFSNLF